MRRAPLAGTLRKDGRWQIVLTLTRPDGAKVRRTLTAASQREVQAQARDLLQTTQRRAPNEITVADLIDELRRGEWAKKRPKTIEQYEWACRYILPKFGKTRVADLTPPMIARWLQTLLAQGNLGGRSIQIVRGVLRSSLGYGVDYGMLPTNPARESRLPTSAKAVPRPKLTPEWLERIVAAEVNPNLARLWVFLSETGLRPFEALRLTGRDLRRDAEGHYWVVVTESKTDAGVRRVPIRPELAREVWPESLDALVFPNGSGRMRDRHNVSTRFKRTQMRANERETWRARELGVEPRLFEVTNLYQLRKFAATRWIAAGVADDVVKVLMGHASITLTKNIYDRVQDSRILDELRKVDMANGMATLPKHSG